MDVTDTYQEQLVADPDSPSGLSTIYLDNPEPVIPIPVTFRFNQLDGVADNLAVAPPGNGIPSVVLIVPRRNSGPLVGADLAAGIGLSVQYTGFSGSPVLESFRTWNMATNLDEFRKGLEFFDFGSQNWAYVDVKGNIAYFTSAEMPLREDLQSGTVNGLPPWFIRNGTGGNEWLPASNPQPGQTLAFEILPADEMPHVVNPPAGWFVNANNDPAGTTLDNNPLNQLRPGGGILYLNPFYGASGYRAGRITQALKEAIQAGPVTRADMQAIQADVQLLDAQVLTPSIVSALENASQPDAHPMLADLAADPRVAEAVGRLAAWDYTSPTGVPEGYDASDVDGECLPPTQDEIDASIAATIYSVWRGQVIANTIDATLEGLGLTPPTGRFAMAALRHLLDTFDTQEGVGASGVNFFNVSGVAEATVRRDILILKSIADALDLLAGPAFEPAFGGSTDQNDYRWGRLHRVVLTHPLGSIFSIPPAGGAFPPSFEDLPGVAVDGGFGGVDASNHPVRGVDADDFMFRGGPVRRYVGGPGGGKRITGETSLPGGESGVLGNPWYANLLGNWLTNEAHPQLQTMQQIKQDTTQKTLFLPARR